MPLNRKNPSPEYRRLIDEYRHIHLDGCESPQIPGEETYAGYSTFKRAEEIRLFLMKTPCRTLLDYGSGKGKQYDTIFRSPLEPDKLSCLKDYWELESITCYDPAFPPFEKLPEGKFDAVICVDVLEHVPEKDLGWILDEIFSKANKMVFVSVACYPAKKELRTGENAHSTVQPPHWWRSRIAKSAAPYPKIKWRAVCEK